MQLQPYALAPVYADMPEMRSIPGIVFLSPVISAIITCDIPQFIKMLAQ